MGHVVITGGAGFIGSHLAEVFLAQGERVTAVDNFVTGSRDNVLQVSFDFENVLNMFSSSWGVRQVATTAATNPLACTTNPCTIDGAGRPELSFNGVQETFTDDLSEFSRWRIQLGLRYFLD